MPGKAKLWETASDLELAYLSQLVPFLLNPLIKSWLSSFWSSCSISKLFSDMDRFNVTLFWCCGSFYSVSQSILPHSNASEELNRISQLGGCHSDIWSFLILSLLHIIFLIGFKTSPKLMNHAVSVSNSSYLEYKSW